MDPIPQRHWWRMRVGLDEKIWITVAYAWCLVMTVWMVGWFFVGNQNQAGEAFRVTTDGFTNKMDEMIASQDVDHGFSLLPINLNLQLIPGYDYVLRFTPNKTGVYRITCNEFCGLGHHTMAGKLYVIDTANNVVLDGKGGVKGGEIGGAI